MRSFRTIFAAMFGLFAVGGADASPFAVSLAISEATQDQKEIHQFYAERDFELVWFEETDAAKARRDGLFFALERAENHGLPEGIGNPEALAAQLENLSTISDLVAAEMAFTNAYLNYAAAIGSGLVNPKTIAPKEFVRKIERPTPLQLMTRLSEHDGNFRDYLVSLAPQSSQYRALMAQKRTLEVLRDAGGWGATVPDGKKMSIGSTSPRVVDLRNRLVRLGYLTPRTSVEFDVTLDAAVKKFQSDHGLAQDGVVGPGTLAELNRSVSDRLRAVVVALERERWIPRDLGERHILVNQTDFTARIYDNGEVTFETRAVIGQNIPDQRSPEFSDEMEHMVINPSWYVPRSIITKEYLPQLQQDPFAVNYLEITDRSGRRVSREAVDFTQYTRANFPYAMRQPPGRSNALGLVKFMFPNRHNIYLHDTPQKSLFSREKRAFSHGCIRLQDPFDFAYALLALQVDNPEAYFQSILSQGKEATVPLEKHVPVHLIYRTAFMGPRGEVGYRRDVYGRDAKIWEALQNAGVTLGDQNG